ncbi:MAG: L,D-transpeptidase family protein [Bacteroidota bacterium]|nr:MAG: L,D-transpeptidase family protein [Bacteroidota bacterium]
MKRRLFFAVALIFISLIVYTVVVASGIEPPHQEITEARKKLAVANVLRSPRYARESYKVASSYYDSAMYYWQQENQRFFLFRDYERARVLALEAFDYAETAIHKTRNAISSSEELLGVRVSSLQEQLNDFEKKYDKFPFERKDRKNLVKCNLLLHEGILLYEKADYHACKVKLDAAQKIFDELNGFYKFEIEAYFENYSQWKKWVNQTISYSRRNKTTCIIVDKIARKCFVYKNGREIQQYDVELGPNWVGTKIQQGDKKTPEGHYKIVKKLTNGSTIYHKALLLDYPNEDDQKRFLENKKNGTVPKGAKIGNLIEIHGNGGKGADWTNGCVALTDSEMDKLFATCSEGTKVTIVGSMKPLKEIFPKEQLNEE